MSIQFLRRLAWCGLVLFGPTLIAAETNEQLLKQLQSVKAGDEGTKTAALAVQKLQQSNVPVIDILKSAKGATPLGRNWLFAAANTAYRKLTTPPTQQLQAFLEDQSQDAEARYLVFEWLTSGNAALRKSMLASMVSDSSPELRHAAIAAELEPETLPTATLQKLLADARHPDQVIAIIERLEKQDVKIDQAKHFGFITEWELIGPFDNVGTKNFNKAFPVESDAVAGSLKKSYEGKSGAVEWKSHTTTDKSGVVDLGKVYDNEKGCIVYAATTVTVAQPADCEIRIGCINGNKVWVNGQLVISNEVYHTGMQIDQYSAPIRLKAGANTILLKLCQNEQKEPWAQNFQFQVRLCDSTGKAFDVVVKK